MAGGISVIRGAPYYNTLETQPQVDSNQAKATAPNNGILGILNGPNNPGTFECCSWYSVESVIDTARENGLGDEPEVKYLETAQCVDCDDLEIIYDELTVRAWGRAQSESDDQGELPKDSEHQCHSSELNGGSSLDTLRSLLGYNHFVSNVASDNR